MVTALSAAGAMASVENKRVALVIGNSKYVHAMALPNPANDANLMTATLRDAGFEVIEGTDLDKAGMLGVIDKFTEASYDAEVALVYYSGHGMQVEGHNFLIPIDAELTSPAHLKTRTIQVEEILAALPADPAIGVIILDACRDNPLSRSLAAALPATRSTAVGTGLAPVQAASVGTGTGGTLIAYATDPGAVALDGKGSNSPYTTALAKYIAAPGVELQSALTKVRGQVTEETMGKQRPWHNASLGREVFLGGKAPEPAPAPVASASQPIVLGAGSVAAAAENQPSSWDIEQRLWDEASKRDSVKHYEVYLEQFPNGRFATVARLSIDQLKETAAKTEVASLEPVKAVEDSGSAVRTALSVPDAVKSLPGTEITEAALALDRAKRIDLQLRLKALGFDVGSADGNVGPRSRRAIAAWQKSHQIPETGFFTRDQHTFLNVETEPMMAAVRAQHEEGLAVERQRAADAKKLAVKKQATKKQVATTEQPAPRNQKKKRKVRVVQDDGPDENLGRVENGGGSNDAVGKALLFGTGVAVGGILLKNQ